MSNTASRSSLVASLAGRQLNSGTPRLAAAVLFVFVFARRPVYRASILLALVGVGVLARYGVTHGMWIQTPLTFVDNVACGMLAAIVVVRAWRTRAALAALAFAAALVVGATGGQVAGLAVAGALFAVALALVATSQIVPPRALVWVGTVSYGVYLWHWPVLEVTTNHGLYRLPDSVEIAVVAGTAVLLGWLSWRIVELPALRQRGALVALLPRGRFAIAGARSSTWNTKESSDPVATSGATPSQSQLPAQASWIRSRVTRSGAPVAGRGRRPGVDAGRG